MATKNPTERMCGAKIKNRPGWFCEKLTHGATRCRSHGGAAPQVQRLRTEAVVRKRLHRMVTAVPKTDIEANPLEAFDVEFRKTIATIRFLDELVSDLLDHDPTALIEPGGELARADSLFWGRTKEEEKNAGEFPGTDITYAAGLSIIEVKRQWEREHLVKMTKVWIDAKVDERRLQMGARMVDAIDGIVRTIVIGMGGDPNDTATRKIITSAFNTAMRQPAHIEA